MHNNHHLRTSQGEDAIVDYIRGFHTALQTQLDLMRRFLLLHPKPPTDLDHWERRSVAEFAEQIDDFATSICDMLGIYDERIFDKQDSEELTSNLATDLSRLTIGTLPPESEKGSIVQESEKSSLVEEPRSALKTDALKGSSLCLLNSKVTPAIDKTSELKTLELISGYANAPFDCGTNSVISGSDPSTPKRESGPVFVDWQPYDASSSSAELQPQIETEPAAARLPVPQMFVLGGQKLDAGQTEMEKQFAPATSSTSSTIAARRRSVTNGTEPQEEEEEEDDADFDAIGNSVPMLPADSQQSVHTEPEFDSNTPARAHFRSEESERKFSSSIIDTLDRRPSLKQDCRVSGVSSISGNTGRHTRSSIRRSMRSTSGGVYLKQEMESALEDLRGSWDSEEESSTKRCPSGVLNPQWVGRLGWDILVIILVLFDAMVLPFQMAYKDSDNPDNFDVFWLWLTTTFFACDMVINFFTAYEAGPREKGYEPGALVTRRSRIAAHYLRSWFPIDFVSTIPWSQVTNLFTGGGAGGSSSAAQAAKLTKALKFIRFLRLMRMLRLAKLAQIWERVEQKMGSLVLTQMVALLRVTFMLISICHWNACLWWIIGKPENIFTDLLSEEDKAAFANIPHWTTLPRKVVPDVKTTWRWLDQSVGDAYIFCFYWTLGVMRTMPAEVTPVNKPERVYLMIFMFFAFSAFAISISQITQAFFKFSERKRVFNEDMSALRHHLRTIKAPMALQVRVKAFSRYLFERRRLLAKEQNLLNSLPSHLDDRLKAARLCPHLQKLVVFRALRGEALQLVSELLGDVRDMVPGDFICVRGRISECAWVKVCGRLCQVIDLGGLQPSVSELDGDVVDDDCLIEPNHASPDTVMITICSEMLRIDKRKFYSVRKKHPTFERHLRLSLVQGDGRNSNNGKRGSVEGTMSVHSMGRTHSGSNAKAQDHRHLNEDRSALNDIGAIVSA